MLKVHNVKPFAKTNNRTVQKNNPINTLNTANRGELLMASLNAMAGINQISFMGKYDQFELGLSVEEMKKRLAKENTRTSVLQGVDSPYYASLAEGDKKALAHLVKSAEPFKTVHSVQNNERNLAFEKFLQHKAKMAKPGDERYKIALELLKEQQVASKYDFNSEFFSLIKGDTPSAGKGFYPRDLGKEEFHTILINMLNDGRKEEVQAILSNRTMVQRDGKGALKAVDYTEAFKKEFRAAARELNDAAKHSTNPDFSKYLKLQVRALLKNDPMLDAKADKKWADLQDTPLEYTITRENYEDEMTGSVEENKELKKLLKKNKIKVVSKDGIGVRVGIVDKEGTEMLLGFKKYLPIMAQNMPLSDKYKQNISTNASDKIKQTMVDARLVHMTGDGAGAFIAQNLPNNDKLSLTIGGGRRNVYHADFRAVADPAVLKQRLESIFDSEIIKFYNNDANHWFVIGHENGHSLGPIINSSALGKYESVIEENKADMVSVSMLDTLKEAGNYNEAQKKEIITTFVARLFKKAKPISKDAHGIENIMQINYLQKQGAISFDKKGLVHIDFDKVVPAAKNMLTEIVNVQMSGNYAEAKKYVEENFIWSKDIRKIAKRLRNVNSALDNRLISPLAEKLLKMV